MLSWDAFDPTPLKPAAGVTSAFLGIAKTDLRSAAQYVCGLPYARNSNPNDPLIVLTEERGTCSTKHALLRRLCIEQGLDVALVLGIYEMTERNTPGVGPVLQRHGLSCLPEAHCYLRSEDRRIDVTRVPTEPRVEPIKRFLHEEEIDPTQITEYKMAVHKKVLGNWFAANSAVNAFSVQGLWMIREECVATLSQRERR